MRYVGIDIANGSGVCALRTTGKTFQFNFDAEGFAHVLKRIRDCSHDGDEQSGVCVVMEGTGGYQRPVLEFLRQQQIAGVVLNPTRVRRFCEAMGLDNKTDHLDARNLVAFAESKKPQPEPLPDENAMKLKDLNARREQIVEELTREKNRLKQAYDRDIKRLIEQVIDVYEQQLKEVDKLIGEAITADEVTEKNAKLLMSMPGIASVTAGKLLALAPELGRISNKQIAKLAGLVPVLCESGSYRGKTMIKGGRRELRRALYMPAMVAIRANSGVFRQLYEHHLAKGQARMSALVIVMRKMLITLNAMLRTQTEWNPKNVA